jgi:hypothetical protein
MKKTIVRASLTVISILQSQSGFNMFKTCWAGSVVHAISASSVGFQVKVSEANSNAQALKSVTIRFRNMNQVQSSQS